jgi:hypothetical protein
MTGLGQQIKDFVKEQGVDLVGVAGSERLDGPPSLDPTYTLKRARSVVSFAIPMEVNAIYDFLSKKSPAPHNLDQVKGNQFVNRVAKATEEFIESKGHRARMVPANNDYRKSFNPIFVHPSFSHRFGAIITGLAAQGLSGNVMTKEHGACVYLGSVVTGAELESDPMLPPRYMMDNECKTCRLCAKSCASQMFLAEEEEQVLLNGEFHPRGKRRNLMLCMCTCFGMHALSYDKKWTTWGKHWIKDWIGNEQDPTNKSRIRKDFGKKVMMAGDSGKRYEVIRTVANELHPAEAVAHIPDYGNLPEDEIERDRLITDLAEKYLGVAGLEDPTVLTCGQCGLVCGPTLEERSKRVRMLQEGGLVVAGEDGRMIPCDTYEEACEIREKYPRKVSKEKMKADQKHLSKIFTRRYFGFEPKTVWQDYRYQRKLKKAAKEQGVTPG